MADASFGPNFSVPSPHDSFRFLTRNSLPIQPKRDSTAISQHKRKRYIIWACFAPPKLQRLKVRSIEGPVSSSPDACLPFHSTRNFFYCSVDKKNRLITKLLFSLGSDRSVQRKFINLWCASQSNSVQRHDLAIFRSLRLAAQRWSTKKRRRKRKELERRFNVLPNRIFVSRSSNFTKFRRKFESCSFRTHPNVSFVSL